MALTTCCRRMNRCTSGWGQLGLGLGLGHIGGDHDAAANLALHLHGDLHLAAHQGGFVPGGPGVMVDGLRVAQVLPHFLGDVGRNGVEQQQQGLQLGAGDGACGVHLVDQGHHGGDGRVVLHGLVVLGDLLDGLVHQAARAWGVALALAHHLCSRTRVQEPAAALRTVGGPRNRLVEGAHEHLVQAEGVRAQLVNDVVGVDGRFPRTWTSSRRSRPGSLRGWCASDRFGAGNQRRCRAGTVPEAAVEQMQGGVLHPPLYQSTAASSQGLLAADAPVKVRVAVAHEVPGGTGPLGHGVGLALAGPPQWGQVVLTQSVITDRGIRRNRGLVVFHIGSTTGS